MGLSLVNSATDTVDGSFRHDAEVSGKVLGGGGGLDEGERKRELGCVWEGGGLVWEGLVGTIVTKR